MFSEYKKINKKTLYFIVHISTVHCYFQIMNVLSNVMQFHNYMIMYAHRYEKQMPKGRQLRAAGKICNDHCFIDVGCMTARVSAPV